MADTIAYQLKNNLDIPVEVFHSTSSDDPELLDYLGELTSLGKVTAGQTISIPMDKSHRYVVFITAKVDGDKRPISRIKVHKRDNDKVATIESSDVEKMAEAFNFVSGVIAKELNGSKELLDKFNKIWHDQNNKPSELIKNINNFFAATESYQNCDYVAYCVALSFFNRELKKKASMPVTEVLKTVGLGDSSTKIEFLKGISLQNVHMQAKGIAFSIWGTLHIADAPNVQSLNEVIHWVDDLHPVCLLSISPLEVKFVFYYSTSKKGISFGGDTLILKKPNLTLSYSAAFKFGLIELQGDVEFSIFDKNLSTHLSATVDSEQVNLGFEIKNQKEGEEVISLPIAKGFHLTKFGLEGGCFFKPPALEVGASGEFKLGESNHPKAMHNEFGIVLEIEGEIIKPVYLSFSVPDLSVNELLTLFTDEKSHIPTLLNLQDVSCYYAPKPVVLPNGHLADMGFGASAALKLLGFDFYGRFKITFGTGIHAQIQCSPINWGHFLKLSGDGKTIKQYIDKDGNLIQLQETNAKANAKDKNPPSEYQTTLVEAGGPTLHISTSESPYLHLDFEASFLGFAKETVIATIDNSNIIFDIKGQSRYITNDIGINIYEHHPVSVKADFKWGFDHRISLPFDADIHLQTEADIKLYAVENGDNLDITTSIDFDFEGLNFSVFKISISPNIQRIEDLAKELINVVEEYIEDFFGPLWKNAKEFAKKIGKWVKDGLAYTGKALSELFHSSPFNLAADEVTHVLKSIGEEAGKIAEGLKKFYHKTSEEVSKLLNDVGLSPKEIGKALRHAFDSTEKGVANAFKYIGKGAKTVAHVCSDIFNSSTSAIADACQYAGYAANETANALSSLGRPLDDVQNALGDAYDLGKDELNDVLDGAGYAVHKTEEAVEEATHVIIDGGKSIIHHIGGLFG